MTCPREPETLLWLYGEADDPSAVEAHLVGCAPCRAVVAEHETVATALAPMPVDALTAVPTPARANRAGPLVFGGLLALAAAALLVVGLTPDPVVQAPLDTDVAAMPAPAVAPDFVDPPLFRDVDAELEALDLELADLSHDFHTL